MLGATDLVDRLVDDFDGVKLIEGDRRGGQAFGGAADESRPHVDAIRLDGVRIAAMRGGVLGERRDGGGILASVT